MNKLFFCLLFACFANFSTFSQKGGVKARHKVSASAKTSAVSGNNKNKAPRSVKGEGGNATIDGHPGWIMQGNIYEVNVRQYTQEGTFKAFAAHLNRLKDMGVQTLWFMPINPISKVARKGTLGSYYAVANYTAINPEFGNMDDWKELVKTIHSMGMKVIIDWVPNHTGADHYWLTTHPDFYEKDSIGKPAVAFDWVDTRSLNYDNKEMRDSMIASMQFWIRETDIDGFRCDVAGEVPDDFWAQCIPQLRKLKNIFMLAEADKPSVHLAGFDASYGWDYFAMSKRVAAGERPAYALDSVLNKIDTTYPKNALKLYFTSNHDENSWNKADFGTMPGASHAPFVVLTQTLVRTAPLIYSGQEEPITRAIEFFEKDPMNFENLKRAKFYKTLLNLRSSNEAFASNASFKRVDAGNPAALFAFVREKGGKKALVICNLSKEQQSVALRDKSLYGMAMNVFAGTLEPLSETSWNIEPWGYAIYEYGSAGQTEKEAKPTPMKKAEGKSAMKVKQK